MNEEFVAEMIARAIVHGVVRPSVIPTHLSQSTKSRAMKRMVESQYLERASRQKYVPGGKLLLIMQGDPTHLRRPSHPHRNQ